MEFNLSPLAIVILGNAILIAIGVTLISYFEKKIKRWLEEEAARNHQVTNSNGREDYPSPMIPESHDNYRESHQPYRQPLSIQTPPQAAA